MSGIANRLRKIVIDSWFQLTLSAVSIVAFLVVWWLVAAYLHGEFPFPSSTRNDTLAEELPYWWDVLKAFGQSFVTANVGLGGVLMTQHIISSLKRIAIGFVLAMVIAVPLGLVIGRSRNAEAAGRPIVEVFRPIPPLAWVPIFLVVFKFFWGPILIVFLGIFFPILLNVRLGARSVDPVLLDAARTLGAKRRALFTKVVLPYTTPYLMTGITVGLGIGWMCIVAAEMLGTVGGGVGYYIYAASNAHLYEFMFAGMLMIAILSILTTGIAGLVERWLRRWMGLK